VAAARSRYLLDLLAQVPDPRKRRGRRHALAGLLAVGMAAVIAGARSFAAIGQWAADAGQEVLSGLGAARGPAEESTFRRAFALVSPDVLDRVLGAWLWTRAGRAGGRLVIAVDGKAVRGAKGRDGKAPHLVAALAHGIGAVLGQVAVDAKSNEIPAVRDLLKAFADLAGAVITIDALHTQSDTAQVITGRGADYVMTVKGNMPTLYKRLKKLPWAAVPAASSVSRDHGRRARRTIKAALVPSWIEFAGAAQVAQLRRTVTKKGKKTVEVVYLITSDRDADPATLAAWVRSHWEIENRLHWVRSPGVPSLLYDVAPNAQRRASATHLHGCHARCRCCSDAERLGTGRLVQHLWRDYPVLINRGPGETRNMYGMSGSAPPEKIRDVTYQEDKSLVRTGNAPRVMATLRIL
jgi:predicted transposase YbfD/YdcC